MRCRGIRYGMMRTVDVGQATSGELREKRRVGFVAHDAVYVRRDISECSRHTVAKPIRLLWVDTNKGDNAKENYPLCLVVRQRRYHGADGRAFFVSFLVVVMALLEAITMFGSLMVTKLRNRRDEPLRM